MTSLDEITEQQDQEPQEEKRTFLNNRGLVADAIPFCLLAVKQELGEYNGIVSDRLNFDFKTVWQGEKHHQALWLALTESRKAYLSLEMPAHWAQLIKIENQPYRIVGYPKEKRLGPCPCERFTLFTDKTEEVAASDNQKLTIAQNAASIGWPLPKNFDTLSEYQAGRILQWLNQRLAEKAQRSR